MRKGELGCIGMRQRKNEFGEGMRKEELGCVDKVSWSREKKEWGEEW